MTNPLKTLPSQKSTTTADYEVGYGRPPKETRFQKGVSGNPMGKRAKTKNRTFTKLIAAILAETVEVPVDGRTVTLSMMQVIVQRLGEKAAKGSKRALRKLLDLREFVLVNGEFEPTVIQLSELEALAAGPPKSGESYDDIWKRYGRGAGHD